MDLFKIKNPLFLKELDINELNTLSLDIRKFLIENITKTGGHLSSNLGVVELTIALHYIFDFTKDKLIFDVGHQSYVHKILTGRAQDFSKLRKLNGLSGFQSIKESDYDHYEAGHSSTSVSALTGYLISNKINNKDDYVVSVIGDASFTNGLVFEALNHLGLNKDYKGIIILNDNKMGISETSSSLSSRLSELDNLIDKFKINNIFNDLGFEFFPLVDGHNFNDLINVFNKAKKLNKLCIIHVQTIKGNGFDLSKHSYDFNMSNFKSNSKYKSWSYVISSLVSKLNTNEDIYCIVPAMIEGSRLDVFQEKYPNNLIDVGIAESHAGIIATVMSMNKIKVFLSYYSTFAQRAYDQFIHDLCYLGKGVVVGIDRANLVGEDGRTHQGIYDLAYISHIPNTIICMPSNYQEAYDLLKIGFNQDKIFFIRYPKNNIIFDENNIVLDNKLEIGKWNIIRNGEDIIIISYGDVLYDINDLIEKNNIDATIINALFINKLDTKLLNELASFNKPILIYEQVVINGSLYQNILTYFNQNKIDTKNLYNMSFDNIYVEHGNVNDLLIKYNLDMDSLYKKINEIRK